MICGSAAVIMNGLRRRDFGAITVGESCAITADYRAANGRAQAAVLQPSPGLALRPWRRFSRRFATGRAKSCPRP